jgi:hypothetical protein
MKDLTGKVTSESNQISRYVSALWPQIALFIAPCGKAHCHKTNTVWPAKDCAGIQRKRFLLKVPILEKMNVCFRVTNSFDIKKTAQLKFLL